jgi:hypothetical protein
MQKMERPAGTFTVVIPCAADKRDGAHPARDLYTSSNFRNTLAAAEALAADEGGQVLILSALYGLVEPDEVIHSYDVKMGSGHPAEVTVGELAEQLGELDDLGDVHCLLPGAYFDRLDAAAREVGALAFDLYEGDAGIGFQRGTVRVVRETSVAALALAA